MSIDPILMPQFLLWGVTTFILLVSFAMQLWKNPGSLDYSVLRRMIFPVFLGYLFFSSVSLIKAVNVTEGVYEVLKIFVSLVYLFIATIILSRNRSYYSILVKAVLVIATILSLIAICQYFLVAYRKPTDVVDATYSVSATMAHKNLLSSSLLLTLPFCLYALLVYPGYWKVASIIPTALIILDIALLQTRSVWLGLFLSTVATAIVLTIFAKRLGISKKTLFKRATLPAIVLITAILILGCFYFKSNRIGPLVERIRSISSRNYASNIERILIWRKSAEAIKDNLILGHGCGNWKIVHLSYGLDKMPKRALINVFFQRPHNDYIWVLSEIGIPGFVFYLSIFAVTIGYIFRIITRHTETNSKLLSIFIFFGIVGYMVDAFFSFPKERIFHSILLLLMMAIIVSIYHQSLGYKKNIPRSFMFALTIPSLALLLSAIAVGYIRLNAEIHTKRAFAARNAQNWLMVISEIDKGYSVFATLDPMSTPLQWYRGEADFLLNNVSQALEDYKKAYNANPYHIHVLNNLATCYELMGNHNEAIKYYNNAIKIHPKFEEALINLGATYYNCGRYEEAYETLLRCDPDTKDPRLEKYLEFAEKRLDKHKNF